MTSEKQSSTSSIKTEDSRLWKDIEKLGERILEGLSSGRHVDTTTRWIAYRIAELMEKTKRAKSQKQREIAQKDCAELIIRLWEHREHWPHGRPLADIIEAVEEFTNWSRSVGISDRQPESATWLGILPFITSLQEDEFEWCRRAAIAEFPIRKEQQWLKERPEDFSAEELKFLEQIIALRDELDKTPLDFAGGQISNFTALSKRKRSELIRAELAAINAKRLKILDKVSKTRKTRQKRTRKKHSPSPGTQGVKKQINVL